MPRISPWDSRFPMPAPDRTITIPLPEMETEIVLVEGSDEFRLGQSKDLYDNYCALYVPQRGRKARQPLMAGGITFPPSRELFLTVAAVETLQAPPAAGELPWSLPDLLGIIKKFPDRWEEIKMAAIILTNPVQVEDEDPGNSPAGPTTPGSGST